MPGYIVHLAAAKELIFFLKQNNFIKSDKDVNDFLVASIIPDAVSDKTKTHYRQTDDKNIQIRFPLPWRLADRYKEIIKTPIGIGYLFHLYVDYLFYNEYFSKHILLTDEDGNLQVRKDKIKFIKIVDFNKTLPGRELFEKKLLYDDYTILNSVLEEQYHLSYDFKPVENPGFEELDFSKVFDVKKEILYYSKQSKEFKSEKTSILKLEPLLEFIKQTAPRFMFDVKYWIY